MDTIDTSAFAFPKPGGKFKSGKNKRRLKTGQNKANIEKVPEYLKLVAALPCIITGRFGVQVCHVSFGMACFGKPENGMGIKAADRWVLPMTPEMHAEQHSMGEREFWRKYFGPQGDLLALLFAQALYEARGNPSRMIELINEFRKMRI